MFKKVGSWLAILALTAFLTNTVGAVRLGVVVELPGDEVYTKCLTVDGNTNGYEIMEETGLDNTWSAPGPGGHGLCAIEGIGCPSSNCFFCGASEAGSILWRFHLRESGDDSWSESLLWLDGGEGCSKHYCAKEGDLLGFAYGVYGTEPSVISFEEVCPPLKKRRSKGFDVSISPKELFTGDSITLEIKDSSTGEGISGVEVDVLNGHKVSGETDVEGRISFKLDKPGVYKLRVNARGYNPPQRYLMINVESRVLEVLISTTSTSSTTTSTSITSSTTTSTTSFTTTTSSSTTTSTLPSSTTTSSTSTTSMPGLTGRVVESPVEASFLVFISVILVLVAYLGYTSYKKYEKRRETE
ncbi:MAG: carboxypeptidase-like regulatory domain-containing protein [Candidatus Altiarchaeota archaeon]|nr:carboxypeptidase-like regulatory domain-containing protein [Candidatus Altiarchaeota archaeon]